MTDKLEMIDKEVDYVLKWIPIHNKDTFNWYSIYEEEFKKQYNTYDDFMKMVFKENTIAIE